MTKYLSDLEVNLQQKRHNTTQNTMAKEKTSCLPLSTLKLSAYQFLQNNYTIT